MKLSILCLGLLREGSQSGYELHKRIGESMGHFQHASFGALYPALAKLEAGGLVHADQVGAGSMGKRVYEITDAGHEKFASEISKSTAAEDFRSDFLSALYFAECLSSDEVNRLIDQRLADHRDQLHRLRALPISSMTEGQRFTLRYALAQKIALIEFLQGEGRAIVTAMERNRY
jgi:PadR family transcriptional regulator, regulatory protein AphA